MKALGELPQARDLETLDAEQSELLNSRSQAKTTIENGNAKLATWKETYGTVEQLLDLQVNQRAKQKTLNEQLADTPRVPEGFDTIQRFLNELEKRENRLAGHTETLQDSQQKKARLEGGMTEKTVEELEPELEEKERAYKHEQERGKALLRIQRTVQNVIAKRERGHDPMDDFQEKVQTYFNLLTQGRYNRLSMDGPVPEEAVANGVAVHPDQLSQGTRGSLALALRLAHAEAYLQDTDGFLLLDDPFVDLDPDRRKAAIDAVARFSKEKQVIFFTCHPHHAEALVQAGGARIGENGQLVG